MLNSPEEFLSVPELAGLVKGNADGFFHLLLQSNLPELRILFSRRKKCGTLLPSAPMKNLPSPTEISTFTDMDFDIVKEIGNIFLN